MSDLFGSDDSDSIHDINSDHSDDIIKPVKSRNKILADDDEPGTSKPAKLTDVDDLDDDDINLIAENTGIDVKKSKRKRVILADSDEDEAVNAQLKKKSVTRASSTIQKSFEKPKAQHNDPTFYEFEEDDLDDFIVDDVRENETVPAAPHAKRPAYEYQDMANQEAQDIFGAEFDFNEYDILSNLKETEETAHAVNLTENLGKVYELAELEKAYLTQSDINIKLADIPERMQRRQRPVESIENSFELDEEASFIFDQGFCAKYLLDQSFDKDYTPQLSPSLVIDKIKDILSLIKNEKFEVVYILRYRKEIFEPEFRPEDVWLVYDKDEEWMQLKDYRKKLTQLMIQMRKYQKYFENKSHLIPLDELGMPINLHDIDRISSITKINEIRDFHDYFSFYYLPTLRQIQRRLPELIASEVIEELTVIDVIKKKYPECLNYFNYCKKSGIDTFIQLFGLTSLEFGENLLDGYARHIPKKHLVDPKTSAQPYIGKYLPNIGSVLKAATKMWALNLAYDPVVRSAFRRFFYSNAKISCYPTVKGRKEIDVLHPYSEFKYLREKPVALFKAESFLMLLSAETEGFVKVVVRVITEDRTSYTEIWKPYYERDEYLNIVQEWNALRREGIKMAFDTILMPKFEKELKSRLYLECQNIIIKSCCLTFFSHINVTQHALKKKGKFIFAISIPPYHGRPNKSHENNNKDLNNGECAILSIDGTYIELFPFNSAALLRGKINDPIAQANKEESLSLLEDHLNRYQPSAIVFNLDHKEGIDLANEIEYGIIEKKNYKDGEEPLVEVVSHAIPTIAAKSENYLKEFPKLSLYARQAISAGRYSLDPMLETLQLFENLDDATSIILHPIQRLLNKEFLHALLERKLIEIVNLVGVDIHRCVYDSRYSNLLKYICGLGPSKATHILGSLRKGGDQVKTRSDFITYLQMGPHIFQNCSAFLRISLPSNYDDNIEPLDNTRIHPESYEWARKLIADALEIEESSEEINYVEAMTELSENSQKLFELNLTEFLEELHKQGFGNKITTLEDIRAELSSNFTDMRPVYRPFTKEELFWILGTNGLYLNQDAENDPNSPIFIGRIISGIVINFAYRRPSRTEVQDCIPTRETSGIYFCPFCKVASYPDLSDLWLHIDQNCLGYTVGIRLRLENGLTGFIHNQNISDDANSTPQQRVKIGMSINCKILSTNPKRFELELSSKTSDLNDFKTSVCIKDPFYDYELENSDALKEIEKQEKQKKRVVYHKKIIFHPYFKNVTFEEAESILSSDPHSDFIIRPSSKGPDHIAVTIKIQKGLFYHIDVTETDKSTSFILGKKLWIDNECYEDLDEIIARYVTPYIENFRDVLKNKLYFFASEHDRSQLELELKRHQESDPQRIPYLLSVSTTYPGKIYLAFLPKSVPKYEYITITNAGYRYRNYVYKSLPEVVSAFKNYYKEQIVHSSVKPDQSRKYEKHQSPPSNYVQNQSSTYVPTQPYIGYDRRSLSNQYKP